LSSLQGLSTNDYTSSDEITDEIRIQWIASQCHDKPENTHLFSKSINLVDFQVIKTIGKGAFSKVLLVKKKANGKYYAMKVINKKSLKSNYDMARIIKEKQIFQTLDSPFVVKIYSTFQTATKIYFILELVNGGQLAGHMHSKFQLKEKSIKFYAAEIAMALK
jgi:serine/threonine protein kinase